MEQYLPISFLNDFVFCPRSIYFHQLYKKASTKIYHDDPQTKGLIAHQSIDEKTYSSSQFILLGLDVYSERYNLCGKLDIFNSKTKELSERKKKIKTIYPGYIYQLYAQYFCLIEMGYEVEKLKLYSLDDNKSYPVLKPEEDFLHFKGFEQLIRDIQAFDLKAPFTANPNKCQACIYNNLCDEAILC